MSKMQQERLSYRDFGEEGKVMEAIDLFKDWTPEMVAALCAPDGRKKPRSEETKRKISEITSRPRDNDGRGKWERTPEDNRENAKRNRERFARMPLEEKEEFLLNSFLSPEAKEKSNQGKRRYWDSLTSEEIAEKLARGWHSEESIRKSTETKRTPGGRERASRWQKEAWDSLSPEDRQIRLDNGLQSAVANGNRKEFWGNLSEEEKLVRARNSFQSDEAIKNRIEACKQRPTIPERFCGRYLEEKYPGKWIYNGDNSQREYLESIGYTGLRIPDFIRTDSTKEAISVMGGLGFAHFLGDETDEIEYYAKHGWKCTVIWEWDIPGELDKIMMLERG